MPTYGDLEKATGASRTLLRAIVHELDPKGEQHHKEGKQWVMTDQLASAVAHEASKRSRRSAEVGDDGPMAASALELLERSHRRELESLREAHETELRAAETVSESLREVISERDRTIETLRAENASLRADGDEMRKTIASITGARWYQRAFSLRKLLPSPTSQKKTKDI